MCSVVFVHSSGLLSHLQVVFRDVGEDLVPRPLVEEAHVLTVGAQPGQKSHLI